MGPRVPSRFGAELQRLRKEAGLTQAQLAERAQISQRGLQDLERGTHQAPRWDTINLLAAALGLAGQDRVAFLATTQAQSLAPPALLSPLAPVVPEALVPLVGREAELALLHRFLAGEGERTDAARVLFLAGEPGIGKTRLLQAAAQEAVARGWCVLFGGCQRRGGEDPYAPLPEALAHHIDLRPPESLGATLAGCTWLVRLARLAPELAEVLGPLPSTAVAPEQERRLIHAAVARVLANVAGTAGTLLILDDLQWAGPDALDVINTLARIPGTARIVGAYRDTEVGPADPLGLLLADLAQARLATRQQLGPLAEADAAVLLEDLLVDTPDGAGVMDEVLRHAGGTPFFLVSYAQALRQGGMQDVPWDVAQGVRQRAAMLPEIARLVLGVAAVVGRRVSRHALTAAMEHSEDAVLAGLEAACRARLLVEDGDDAYIFAHDLIREVLEADLGAARRAMLHRQVAEALEGDPAGAAPELLAYHYVRAGIPDKAVGYLEMAGDRAASQYANGVAEEYYRQALKHLEGLRLTDDVARLHEKLGLLLYRIGKYEEALTLLEAAAATYRSADDWAGLVRVTGWIGWAHAQRGTPAEGIASLRALLRELDQHAAPTPRAELHCALGRALYSTGQYEEALATCERAIDLAPGAGVNRSGILAEWPRMYLLILLGRPSAARHAGQETLPRAEVLGDWLCLSVGHRYLAELHILYGALEAGQEHVTRSLASATALGGPAQISLALTYQGWIRLLRGDLAICRRCAGHRLCRPSSRFSKDVRRRHMPA